MESRVEWRRGSDRGALTRTRSWWAAVVQAVVTMLLLMISSRCYVSVIQMKVGYELCADKKLVSYRDFIDDQTLEDWDYRALSASNTSV